ncbi:TPA: transposase [Streptococcus pneumoniae]|nr:transposase [Streptococcus pneumoniae]
MGKERREQRNLERKKRVVKKRKIPLEELKAFVEAHPDAFLREIAARFDCALPSVWAVLKQIKVILKKMASFREQKPEKVSEFLDILDNLKDLPVLYIDETGINRYLYRPYAGAPRGEKVYDKISGRRFERTNEVEQKLNGSFLIRYIDSQIRERQNNYA